MPIPAAPPSGGTTAFAGDYSGSLNGLPFGVATPCRTVGVSGWRDMVSLPLGGSGQLAPRSQGNGSHLVPHYMPTRVVTLQFAVEALPGEALEGTLSALEAATQPAVGEVPVVLQVGGKAATAYGTVTARMIPTTLDVLAGYTLAQIEVTCTDPRKFADPITLAPIALPSSTGGLTWPITWPITWAATVATGSGSAVNDGNTDGPVTLRINGPATAPEIVHVESGAVLAFSSGLTVASGDWLDIDCEARTVLYNGQASRNAMLISRGWPSFRPGANTFHFNASSYSATASLQVTATPSSI